MVSNTWCRVGPSAQLRYLDQIAASVVQYGDGRTRDFCRRHREDDPDFFQSLVFLPGVVDEECRRADALLMQRLLVGLGGGIVVRLEDQLCSLWRRWRDNGQPSVFPDTDVQLLHKTQLLGVEPEGFLLVIYVHAGEFDSQGGRVLGGAA